MVNRPEYMKLYRQKTKDKRREYNREYQRKYCRERPEKYILWQVRGRAKKKEIPFNLTLEDIIFPDFCPILGIELKRNIGGNRPSPNSPSVDRIVPELGYTKNNIQIISHRANVMKNDASPEELERFARWVLKL